MGHKNFSLLPPPNYQSYLNIPKVFHLEVQWRGKTDLLEVDLARKTWVFKKESLFMQLPFQWEKAEWGKVLPENPIPTFQNSWTSFALPAKSCLNSET